jgi:N6-adenosine-specific RNA methylase IME4
MKHPPRAGEYGAILADPPWHTVTWGPGGRDRCPDGPRGHYQTMKLAEIAALPVAEWAARDCRLFMWVIDSHLPQSLELGAAWGFRYSAVAFTWAKRTRADRAWQFGPGHATRKGPSNACCFCAGS